MQLSPLNRSLGVTVIVAPVLLLASTLAFAAGGGLNGDEAGGTILIYAFALWIPALFGLARLVEERFPRAAVAVVVLGALGIAGGIAYGLDSVHVAETGTSAEEYGVGPLALQLPGTMFPLANVALAIALIASGAELRRSGWVLLAAGVLFPASRIPGIEALAVVADALFLVAMVPLGLRMLRSRGGAVAHGARTAESMRLT
jgi:hypothetical protein